MFKWANLFNKNQVEENIISPNGRIRFHFSLKSGQIFYSVFHDERTILKTSKLGLLICGENPLRENLKLIRQQKKKNNETIEMPWGEERYINNQYNETAFYLSELKAPYRIFTIRVKIFNNAIAFRYEIPPPPKFRRITIKEELTEFNVDLNATVWKIPAFQPDRYEYNYEKTTIFNLNRSVHTPLTIKTPNGYYLSIHEAALYDYGSMTLRLNMFLIFSSCAIFRGLL